MSAPFDGYECTVCGAQDMDDHRCCDCEQQISAKQCKETEGLCEMCMRLLDK